MHPVFVIRAHGAPVHSIFSLRCVKGTHVMCAPARRYRELRDYILSRRDALEPASRSLELDAADLMSDEPAAAKASGDKKGFA